MQIFEILFLATTILMLIVSTFLGRQTRKFIDLMAAGLLILLLHALFETVRWHMLPCFLVFLWLVFLSLKRSQAHLAIRIFGFVMGMLLLSTSAFFLYGMPIIKLPVPEGRYTVGSHSQTLTDTSREEIKTHEAGDKRQIFVEIWYPAQSPPDGSKFKPKSMWQELYKGKLDRISFFLKYLQAVQTHSFSEAHPDSANGPYPIVLFNHGLQMFTAQNTLLFEHLASHGYVVISIGHPHESLRVVLPGKGAVIPDFLTSRQKFGEALAWIKESSILIQIAQDSMRGLETREARAKIMLEAISESDVNDIVEYWVEDNQIVLDYILSSSKNDLFIADILDLTRIGIMGMSVGGAVAAELIKIDHRVSAGINFDGLQYGNRNDQSLDAPFMMVYSDEGLALNDHLFLTSQSSYDELHVEGSKHVDFTDLPLVWPLLGIYGQLGSVPAKRMQQILNGITLQYWDKHLKRNGTVELNYAAYPEIKVSSDF